MTLAMNSPLPDRRDDAQFFRGAPAPAGYLVQTYAADAVFLDTLTGFVGGGIVDGDGILLLATSAHLLALEERLEQQGIDVDEARETDQYVALDAERVLCRFMIDECPDQARFHRVVNSLFMRARGGTRHVRAFGEMGHILWAKGHVEATLLVEHLWQRIGQTEGVSLFCAYPRPHFPSTSDEPPQSDSAHFRRR